MLDIFSQAKNAIEAYNEKLRVTSVNIANSAVTGFKRLDVSFQSVFNRVLGKGSAADTSSNQGGTNPLQTGGSVAIANVGVDFSQGDLTEGTNLDMAIVGTGMFIVSPDSGTTNYYTRSGKFYIDANQNLVTASGMQLYGFARSGGVTNTGTLVPISLAGQTYTATAVTFDANGVMRQSFNAATGTYGAELPFQIGITTFNNLSGLEQVSGTAFAETIASGTPLTARAPGSAFGTVTPRNLEQSNVFYIGETIDAMEIQRAMSGALTIVKMVNDTISNFVSRVG
jgi:flagellar hook protein FlgE